MLRNETVADYTIAARPNVSTTAGFVPAPGLGPRLTLRRLASEPPPPGDIAFSLGDIELF